MTPPPPDPAPVDRALRTTHRSVLGLIAVCAIVIAAQQASPDAAELNRDFTLVAIALAAVSIIARRTAEVPRAAPRQRVIGVLVGYLAAAGIAIVGVAAAVGAGEKRSGLIFALAAAIFSLRPPPPTLRR